MSRKNAFTIVELMVVVAIIAVLTAILLPALRKAREAANSVACLSNLRQLAVGQQMYAADQKGYVLPAAWKGTVAGATAVDPDVRTNPLTLHNATWATILVDYKYVPAPDQNLVDRTDPTSYLPVPEFFTASSKGNSAFRCPSGLDDRAANPDGGALPISTRDLRSDRPYRSRSLQSGVTIDTWYATVATAQQGEKYDYQTYWPTAVLPDGGGAYTKCFHKMSQLRNAAKLVFLYDGLRGWNIPTNTSIIVPRHGVRDRTNVAFYDGHAETFRRRELLPPGIGFTTGSDRMTKIAPSVVHWYIDQ